MRKCSAPLAIKEIQMKSTLVTVVEHMLSKCRDLGSVPNTKTNHSQIPSHPIEWLLLEQKRKHVSEDVDKMGLTYLVDVNRNYHSHYREQHGDTSNN